MRMKIISLLGFLALAWSQSQCTWSSSGDNAMASVGGGRWKNDDFPANETTQDFSVLFNRSQSWQNRYVYVDNSVPVGLNDYNTKWLPLDFSQKSQQDARWRVMGFKYGMIEPYNTKVPCVSIEGVEGFGVEIMVYALIDVEICIRHKYQANSLNAQSAQLFNDVCGQQRLQHCFIGPNFFASNRPTVFDYEIYVRNTNPPDFSVPVFYRSRKSQFNYQQQGSQLSSGNTEMWCSMISGTVDSTYPEFVSTPNVRIPATGAASGLRVGLVALMTVVTGGALLFLVVV